MSSLKTGIQWANVTWNPITVCDKISPGTNYYLAEKIAVKRLQPSENIRYQNNVDRKRGFYVYA